MSLYEDGIVKCYDCKSWIYPEQDMEYLGQPGYFVHGDDKDCIIDEDE